MDDLMFILLTFVLLLASWGLIRLCDRLMQEQDKK